MAYAIKEAKDLVIQAGKRLADSGLIARTWGNISARISDTQFVITPSGLAYETLTPEQIVVVTIADCSYEGNIKPSSEKGVHADAYRLRREVNFIIHTHQEKASVISMEGENLKIDNPAYKKVLGDTVPCAAYGMPSTGKLRKGVADSVSRYPESKAILMKCHGTLCMGNDYEHSFTIAKTLEQFAGERFEKACGPEKREKENIPDYGKSERRGNSFLLTCDGDSALYPIDRLPKEAPKAAALHSRIYRRSKVASIIHNTEAYVVEASKREGALKPYIDDLAQIAGVNIKKVKNGASDFGRTAGALAFKNAVFIKNEGALCTGKTKEDAIAVGMVLKKGCAAELYGAALGKKKYLKGIDAYLQRLVYVLQYAKKKK